MFKPKERIKHALPLLNVPSVSEAERSILFSPITLGSGVTLADRTWIPAMVPWRATDEGFVTPEVLDWYGRFAEGQPGAIVVEATGIRDVPSGPLLRIGHDRFLPGLRDLTREVRKKSGGRTKLFIQLIDFLRIRRRPEPLRFFEAFLRITEAHRERLRVLTGHADWEMAPESAIRDHLTSMPRSELDAVLDNRELDALRFGERERVTDTEVPSIRDLPLALPTLFANAALRARSAGFDGVELHYAHAYTMASFLSKLNTRTDGYGSSLEGRVRLPLEVLAKVRDAVGSDFTVGCRMLCDEAIAGGTEVEEASRFAVQFAKNGMDFISLSTGGKFEDAKEPKPGEAAYPYTGPSGFECMPTSIADARGPFARNVYKQAMIRRAVRDAGFETPIVVAGGIGEYGIAESILQRGDGDIIGAARQSLADPDWWKKTREGRADQVRRCIYTNYCEALDQKHKSVTCQLWDRTELDEPGVRKSKDGRRRLVAPRPS